MNLADELRLAHIGAAHAGDTGALYRLDRTLDRLEVEARTPVVQSTEDKETP